MKSPDQLRDQVKNAIKTRVGFAVADVHTFMRAKSSKDLRALSSDFSELGGGTFLSAMAGVVLLESLAITLACLRKKAAIVTKQDVDLLFKERDAFCETSKTSKTKLKSLQLNTLRIGSPKNVEECILALDTDVEKELDITLGYSNAATHFDNLWSVFRNNLAHRLAPGWGTAAGSVEPGWLATSPDLQTDRAWFSRMNRPVFNRHHDGTVYLLGEFLVLSYLPRISEWICDLLDECGDFESLQLAALNNLVSLSEDSP